MSISVHQRRQSLRELDLGKVDDKRPEPLLHLLDEQFGVTLTERVLGRMATTTLNSRQESARKLSNCLAYLLARSAMEDPSDDLVANLGPDEAWHVFIHFTWEYMQFCNRHAGEYLHHDPAGESALVNRAVDTAKTVALFEQYGIPYDSALWQDQILYPDGATVIRSGFVAREEAPSIPYELSHSNHPD